jgi:hypothetical protein
MYNYGHIMVQAVSHPPLIAEALVHTQVSPSGICGAQSGNGTGFYPNCSLFTVNIIPPVLHIHTLFQE